MDEAVSAPPDERSRATSERRSRAGARYVDFVVPGLLGMNLMGSGIWGLGFAIVDARRKHLLKRLAATPMSRPQYRLVCALPADFLVIEVVLLLGFAVLVFGVPVRGRSALLAGVCLLSALAFVAGIVLAARAAHGRRRVGSHEPGMLPMWIFSGVFFSSARFPGRGPAVDPRAAAHRGHRCPQGDDAPRRRVGQVLPELAVISAWLVLSFLLAVKLFRWR